MSTENDPTSTTQDDPSPTEGSSVPQLVIVPRGIRVVRLRLKGVDRDYEVDFRDVEADLRSLSVIAGVFSTGKSSVLEFVAHCLGGKDHPQHPEILRKVRRRCWRCSSTDSPT